MDVVTDTTQHVGLIAGFRCDADERQGDNAKSDAFTVQRLAFRTNIELFPKVSRDQLDLALARSQHDYRSIHGVPQTSQES